MGSRDTTAEHTTWLRHLVGRFFTEKKQEIPTHVIEVPEIHGYIPDSHIGHDGHREMGIGGW